MSILIRAGPDSIYFVFPNPDFDTPNEKILARSEEFHAFTDKVLAKNDKMSAVEIRLLDLFD